MSEKTIKVWDINQGKLKHTFDRSNKGHSEGTILLAALDNGELASQAWDSSIKIWNLTEGSLYFILDKWTDWLVGGKPNSFATSLIDLKNGYLASAGEKTIQIWDFLDPKLKFTFNSTNGGEVFSLVQLEDGNLASGDEYGIIKIWDI